MKLARRTEWVAVATALAAALWLLAVTADRSTLASSAEPENSSDLSLAFFSPAETPGESLDPAALHTIFVETPYGPPSLASVSDNGGGVANLVWTNTGVKEPMQFLGFSWDIYSSGWASRGLNNSMWYPYPAGARSGSLDVGFSGGYHFWISNDYFANGWYPCNNPATTIIYSGASHTPADVWFEQLGNRRIILHWRPDWYGTWLYEIIAYKVGTGWVVINGPGGHQYWHFLDYGGAAYNHAEGSFWDGWARFTMPSKGDYWVFLGAVSWLNVPSEWAVGYLHISS